MRVTKLKRGYSMRVSDHEMALLRRMVAVAENGRDALWRSFDTGCRRAYSRRCGKKLDMDLLRVDRDWRGEDE